MKSNKQDRIKWRKLDNSAKIFPISSGKKYSTVFRLSAVLNETVNPNILEQAVQMALNRYDFFRVRLKKGFFWHFLEENTKPPIISKENNYPCKYINQKENNNYLFKVTYFKNKINIDIFHVLTDGNNGNLFFKEIVYCYLELSHSKEFKKDVRVIKNVDFNIEDSYMQNYNKHLSSKSSLKKPYRIKGTKLGLGAISVIHQMFDVEQFKCICNEKRGYSYSISNGSTD